MNTTKRVTKRERFTQLLALPQVKENKELVDFINHELELLTNKNSGEKKPTAQQVANEATKKIIADLLTENHNRLFSISEMQKESAELGELTNQRISALLKQMVEATDPIVEKIVDKRKTYFKAIVGE